MRAFYITFPYKFIYSRAVPVSESHIIVFPWTSQWNADRIFARKNSKPIYPNKWLKFCKSVEDKVPLFEEEDTISAEMGWNTKQEFGYQSLWICGSIYQKTNFHEYSRKVFAKLETWIWLLESTTWLSVFVFIWKPESTNLTTFTVHGKQWNNNINNLSIVTVLLKCK